jgi:hypothetical protein
LRVRIVEGFYKSVGGEKANLRHLHGPSRLCA